MRTTGTGQADAADKIRFVLDGRIVEIDGIDPTTTVLELLREHLSRIDTKEGCAEGDCGACTVVLGELDEGSEGLRYRAVNACIQFAPTLDGKQLITAASLVGRSGKLHPVQQAMVDHHGSQCGFCTPGFVMSMFALYQANPRPSRRAVDEALSGNLCRCTGYRPIVSAAQAAADYPLPDDMVMGEAAQTRTQLESLRRTQTFAFEGPGGRFLAPRGLDELCAIVEAERGAQLLAGGTDIGLWVTKQHRELPLLVYTGHVAELRRVERSDDALVIGAAVTLSEARVAIVEAFPELAELFERFASPPIRNAGTLGGNVANGSPVGDSMPALIALGASLELRKGRATRELALEDFYLGYQEKALEAGELLVSVRIPRSASRPLLRSYKVTKRYDQDISAVCAAFCMHLVEGRVSGIRIALGGMGATVARARACEAALTDQPWNEASIAAAQAALAKDFTPIDDMRATRDYRSKLAANLLQRFFLETTDAAPPGVYEYGRQP